VKVARHARVAPVADLLAWLERAHVEDKSAERMSKLFGILAIGFVIAGIASGIFPVVLPAVPCAIMWWLNRQHDLDDQKLAAATRLLRILRADVSPTHHAKLEVDFRSYMDKAFQRKAGNASYAQPWLSLRARLEDGNELRLEVVRQGKVKRKPKRKYTKVKERVSDLVLLRLAVNRQRYPDPADFAAVAHQYGSPKGMRTCRVRAVRRSVTLPNSKNCPANCAAHWHKCGLIAEIFSEVKLCGY